MANRPIIFSAPMVRALLAGTKTQTRRALNPQPPVGARYSGTHFASDEPDSYFFNSPSGPFKVRQRIAEGDRLWVREAWKTTAAHDAIAPRDLFRSAPVYYTANDRLWPVARYRQAMHMPRWASRLTLTVTDVRVERLQDISEKDAIAEGVERSAPDFDPSLWRDYQRGGDCDSAAISYETLWDAINGPGAWETNPWVAVGTFIVAHQNIDEGAQP